MYAKRVRWIKPRFEIRGTLVGIGIDVCDTERFVGVRERWGQRLERVFSRQEREAFVGSRLGWCWAAREAIVKALHGRMLGSPLADMVVGEASPGELVYRPRERARAQLRRAGVQSVELRTATVGGVAVVVALARGEVTQSPPHHWRLGWGALPWRDPKDASAAARNAGKLVLGRLIPGASAMWSGGHGSPPSLDLSHPNQQPSSWATKVSLSHDGGLSGALVGVRRR